MIRLQDALLACSSTRNSSDGGTRSSEAERLVGEIEKGRVEADSKLGCVEKELASYQRHRETAMDRVAEDMKVLQKTLNSEGTRYDTKIATTR